MGFLRLSIWEEREDFLFDASDGVLMPCYDILLYIKKTLYENKQPQ